MSGYTKLFHSLIHSTIWCEPLHIKVAWVTLLAMTNQDGLAETSCPGLAKAAQITLEQAEEAIAKFLATDPHSRDKTDGRRIESVPGGFNVLNHASYNYRMSIDDRRARDAERKRKKRALLKMSADSPQRPATVRKVSHSYSDPDTDKTIQAPLSVSHSPKKRRWTRIPAAWEPNETHRALAEKLGVNLAHELELIRDHEYKTPKSDPDAAFRTWLRNAKRFAPPRQAERDPTPRELFERADRLAREAAE